MGSMRTRSWPAAVLALIGGAGCGGPSLDLPGAQADSSRVELWPASDLASTPLLFRARAVDVPAGEPWLIRGELSDYYDRALARAELPAALRERAVPLRYWREGADCWLQPLDWLAADEDYTLAFTGFGALEAFHTSSAAQPRARRIFPPPGSAKHRLVVLCDMQASELLPLRLEPGAVPLAVTPSAGGPIMAGCVTLTAERALESAAVSPPQLADFLLDPAPWLPPGAPAPPLDCFGERAHGACWEALDDRVLVTPLADDQLWLLDGATQPLVAPLGVRSVLARGLAPDRDVTLSGSVASSEGSLEVFSLVLRTSPPRPHVVLNEVLSNPLGPEASGEWIELYNDSSLPVSLAGLWLEDSGGRVPLPELSLEPGELALLVAESFAASAGDVAVPGAVRRIPLPSVGVRGLANGGEPLTLVGPDGVISRFPALSASHAGRSWARRTPDAPDGAAGSFAEHGGQGASPGAANTFDDE